MIIDQAAYVKMKGTGQNAVLEFAMCPMPVDHRNWGALRIFLPGSQKHAMNESSELSVGLEMSAAYSHMDVSNLRQTFHE